MFAQVKRILLVSVFLLTAAQATAAKSWEWDGVFGLPGVYGQVYSFATFDDGSGKALYVGGSSLRVAGNVSAKGVAKWTGTKWIAIPGISKGGGIKAMAVFDDGTGPKLYATNGITFSWDGHSWTRLPSMNSRQHEVIELAVFDDRKGPALYAAGMLGTTGGRYSSQVARWDGAQWSPVSSGNTFLMVTSLAVLDDAHGPALYAGGMPYRSRSDDVVVVRLDGGRWVPVGQIKGHVRDLAVYDRDGSGPEPAQLVAVGQVKINGQEANGVAAWNGKEWAAVGNGLDFEARVLAVHERPTGPVLVAGGIRHRLAGSATASSGMSEWDGTTWRSLPNAPNLVLALTSFDHGQGPTLYAGGQFTRVGDAVVRAVARQAGDTWSALGHGQGLGNPAETLCAVGDLLYVGGHFASAGATSANGLAVWNGKQWSSVAGGVRGSGRRAPYVRQLLEHDGTLYVGGQFGLAGEVPVENIARWTGTEWKPLGAGINGAVWEMLWVDEPNGGSLYVGGAFPQAGGIDANSVARWDGERWHALSLGARNKPRPKAKLAKTGCPDHPMTELVPFPMVRGLAYYDDGTGPGLFAGGEFDMAGEAQVYSVAKWTGARWIPLAGGVRQGEKHGRIYAMVVWDDGTGPALYVAGEFDRAGGTSANNIARWDGSEWSALGDEVHGAIRALVVFDDGAGPALYVADSHSSGGIQRWNGSKWSRVASISGVISTLAAYGRGPDRQLCVGGLFSTIDDQVSFCIGCATPVSDDAD